MTELDQLIATAYSEEGKTEAANKVYSALLRTTLYLPVSKEQSNNPEEPFVPLFAEFDGKVFMMIFDTIERLQIWAGEHIDDMDYVALLGRDIVRGVGEDVILCLNFGTDYYKEFAADEITRLKITVNKLDQWAKRNIA